MTNFKAWVSAARLRTLPLSISGIIVGASLGMDALYLDCFSDLRFSNSNCPESPTVWKTSIFWLAILTTIGFQVVSNFANDYGDGIKGTDDNREGEKRMVASGVISPTAMKRGIIITTVITLGTAILLIYNAFGKEQYGYILLFFGLGLASIVAAIKYTVGKKAYGYSGFGDLFVFLFFGLLSVFGTYFLYTKSLYWVIFLPAITIGLLSVSVLNLNNMRDIENDEKARKRTLVVKLGGQGAKIYHYALIITALIAAITYIIFNSPTQFISLIAFIPLAMNLKKVYHNKIPSKLDGELKKVALSTFLFAILFSIFN